MRRIALLPVLLATLLGAPPAHAWTWPVDGPVLRPFLFGDNPYAAGLHRGIDIGAVPGTLVRAPRAGLIRFAGTVPGNGRTVTIETVDGYSVTLLHLGAFSVARGATVAEGDAVAAVGPSDGIEHAVPSVHLGVRVTTDPQGYVDPLPLLPVVAPAVPEASEPEAPAEPESSVPGTPSEMPEASEPEPPVVQEPTDESSPPAVAPVGSVPDLAHTPAIETAPEPASVPGTAETAVPQRRSTGVVETPTSMRGGAPATDSTSVERDDFVGSEEATPSSRLHRMDERIATVGEVVGAAAARDEHGGLPWLPAAALGTALLAALLGRRRQLRRRRAAPLSVRAPMRALPEAPDSSTEAVPATSAAEEARQPTELEPRSDVSVRPPRRSWLRPDPDRGGPRARCRRDATRGRSSRQPVSVVGARRRR